MFDTMTANLVGSWSMFRRSRGHCIARLEMDLAIWRYGTAWEYCRVAARCLQKTLLFRRWDSADNFRRGEYRWMSRLLTEELY